MTSAFELYYKIQKRIHNTRTLHLLNLLAMAGQVGFVFGGFMAYSFHIKELVARYVKVIVLLGFMPYIFVGLAVFIILLVLGK